MVILKIQSTIVSIQGNDFKSVSEQRILSTQECQDSAREKEPWVLISKVAVFYNLDKEVFLKSKSFWKFSCWNLKTFFSCLDVHILVRRHILYRHEDRCHRLSHLHVFQAYILDEHIHKELNSLWPIFADSHFHNMALM